MGEETALEGVLETVSQRIDPDADERAHLESVAEELTERAETAIRERSVSAEIVQVGSTARDTWLSGDHDIDLFVRFPETLDREQLRSHGLEIGHVVLEDGREEYAEHPYVAGEYEGVDVDVVPCYDVPAATDIRSAVDRTPFHNAYVAQRLTDTLAADVRLAKAFCRGIGIYGSDLRTRGFSGYLLELLVLEYDGFESLLSAAREWTPPVRLDPEDHGTATFDDQLVVIDPTDPQRNVAAVLSTRNLARFQHHARALLDSPAVERFEPPDVDALDAEELAAQLTQRGTTLLGLALSLPAQVDDQLYPQLRTSERSIADALDRRGFDVLRSTSALTELHDGSADPESAADTRQALLLFELEVASRPAIERHEGPPVHVDEHATGFYEQYADDPAVYGPFIEEDRYVVERQREFVDAQSFLEAEQLRDVKHGVAVAEALEDEYTVYRNEQLEAVLPDFAEMLGAYFDPEP